LLMKRKVDQKMCKIIVVIKIVGKRTASNEAAE
jgi:hypothetical protein